MANAGAAREWVTPSKHHDKIQKKCDPRKTVSRIWVGIRVNDDLPKPLSIWASPAESTRLSQFDFDFHFRSFIAFGAQ